MTQATHNAIAHIAQVVERVTRTLSQRSIQVEQRGLQVGVEYDAKGVPKKVLLPSISDNPKPELITAIQGFLDKEVSRLLYTDHEYLHANKVGKFKKGMAKSIQNILEDIRTENLMSKEFKGSATNFSNNHDFAIKEIVGPAHATERDPKKRMANLAMPALRAAAGSLAYEEFMNKKWSDLGPLGGAILHYAQEIREMQSTKDSFLLTEKIIKKMQESSSSSDDPDDEGEGGGKGKPSDESGNPGKEGDSKGSPGQGNGSGESNKDGSGKSEGGKKSESKGENSGEGKGNSEGEGSVGSKVEDLSKVNKDFSQRDGKIKPSGSSGTQEGLTHFQAFEDAFQEADWNALVQEKIKQFAKSDHTGKYIPYSREYDYVGPFPEEAKAIAKFGSTQSGSKIYELAQQKSHVIQQQVQRLFIARSMTRHEPGHRRGRINPAALHRLPFGDDKVFRRKVETNSKDVAVSLLIDMSGSMSGTKLQYACVSALMFSNVLTNLGITHEVSAFSTYSGFRSGFAGKMANVDEINRMLHDRHEDYSDRTQYARYAPITNYIVKPFDKRATEDTKKLISMIPEAYHGCMANNVDGESVEVVGLRLLRRKEKKKVMIVMSDGSPAADGHGGLLCDHLVQVVKRLSDAGIEMLGLGLMDASVKRFYPKHQVVQKIEEIPDKILELTRQMVVGV